MIAASHTARGALARSRRQLRQTRRLMNAERDRLEKARAAAAADESFRKDKWGYLKRTLRGEQKVEEPEFGLEPQRLFQPKFRLLHFLFAP